MVGGKHCGEYPTSTPAQIKLTPTEQPQDFFNQVNLLYGSITVFCTATTCPVSNSFLFGLFSA